VKIDSDLNKQIVSLFQDHQSKISSDFAAINKTVEENISEWSRQNGGGGKTIILSGDKIEKAAINFSIIHDNIIPSSSQAKALNLKKGDEFIASGLSVISHPSNPKAPTSHMNGRIFIIHNKKEIKKWWIGGGFDLTPYVPYKIDAELWHKGAKDFLNKFNKTYYSKFAKNCDEYFYLPHRDEQRGIGGIFFDNFKHKNITSSLSLLANMFETYLTSYKKIINRRLNSKFSTDEKEFQLYRRGRYVEFNLLFDRGTKFGIESGGRTDSILASLPQNVAWPGKLTSKQISMNKKLNDFLSNDWHA